MAHWLCVCVVLLVGIGSLEIGHGFLFPSVAPSSPPCVGGSTESDLTLVCNLQYQLTRLLKRYKKSNLSFNPVFYGSELNNTLTATDDCRLPFHKQLNVYNHLLDRVRGLYATTTNPNFTGLAKSTIVAIASLQDKLKASCKADGEDGCSDMNRNQIPAEARNAAIRLEEGDDAANAWGLVLVESLLKRLEPLDNGCLSRRRRRGGRKDRTKKNRRRGGRKKRRQKKDKKADKKAKDRSEKRRRRAERREKRRNRKKRVDNDSSTVVNNTITATTTTTNNTNTTNNNDNNDNNGKVVTDASEHAVGTSTSDVEQVNINVDNGKDSRSSDSDGKKNRRNRRRKNRNKRRNRKNRDKKRNKSKGRRNRRRKSSSS